MATIIPEPSSHIRLDLGAKLAFLPYHMIIVNA